MNGSYAMGWEEWLVRLARDFSTSEVMALSLRLLSLLLRVWTQTMVDIARSFRISTTRR
ncbi:protein of unknown function [Nitrospira defluvii]|uniref:Uncharacterized protein n=1 Tax=Nitrospira defluvii TaxID=330214 RepID=D8PJA7_9BACT|nr:protein of unknown function [Nitrospira defluvii]